MDGLYEHILINYGKKHEKPVKWMNFMDKLIKMDDETSLYGMILAKQKDTTNIN